ncbi:hypothetical protein BC834DRAFT_847896 [Gloeopeniophorella convolvens]|nr:hypothetical protein BC834DRAFT_847896 [Gloeopeniophorella convolvens]
MVDPAFFQMPLMFAFSLVTVMVSRLLLRMEKLTYKALTGGPNTKSATSRTYTPPPRKFMDPVAKRNSGDAVVPPLGAGNPDAGPLARERVGSGWVGSGSVCVDLLKETR